MEPSYSRSWSLKCVLEGPLAPYISSFTKTLDDQGFTPESSHVQTRLVADFSRWLKQTHAALPAITDEHIPRYLRYRARHRRPRSSDTYVLKRMLDFLRQQGAIAELPTVAIKVTPYRKVLDEYTVYLQQERVLSAETVDIYARFARVFLTACFPDRKKMQLTSLRAANVIAFVQEQVKLLHLARAKMMVTALRSFLRYLLYCGAVKCDLSAAVPTVANWSMSTVPRAIAVEHAQAALASCNRQSAVGSRDYAVLLLLARLGLRAGEIVALKLDDIDWDSGSLYVHGKGARGCPMPLPTDVGEAIADYLQKGRPHSTSRAVFLRSVAPVGEFKGQEAIGSIVVRALERAGIDTPRKGAHQFRHRLACDLLRQGASLAEVGELLRHRHPETTAIYAKIDLAALRTLGLPWPGGMQ
ncbi:site-specific recombinase XerD [Paraburkholderia sp. BL6669N2]|uniref:site-specific integrase n=1 Tax=unclassified Paraburkholderia TaxID=2615204 RepID=UPI000E2805EA|nr:MULTISPECIES: site-specific integrase [unclassified Paraburkholderia]REE06508.1 site-specific recombinase XerD [Paraburkholderia sp. BL27I4N3]REG58773.1 site-specific recombinase XerD [Paraburkholderia sp. BL6669N2]